MISMNFNPYVANSYNYKNSVSFNGNIEKIMEILKNATDFKRTKVTVEQGLKIYEKCGYLTKFKAGSHVTITAPFKLRGAESNFQYAMILPHKGNDMSPFDKKRLKFVILGDIESLVNCVKT